VGEPCKRSGGKFRLLGGEFERALWTTDGREKTRLVALFHRQIKIEQLEFGGELCGIGGFRRKVADRTSSGRVGGRMNRVGRPLDEKRQEAASVISKIEGLPLQQAAVGSFAGSRSGALKSDAGLAQFLRVSRERTRVRGPADEARLF